MRALQVRTPLLPTPPPRARAPLAWQTKEAINDIEFQIAQCKLQKENELAVLSGEVTYLNEHQVAKPHAPPPTRALTSRNDAVSRRAALPLPAPRAAQVTVQRKSAELNSKLFEVEAAISTGEHKLQRILHSNDLASADRRRDNAVLQSEIATLEVKFEQIRSDMHVLYQDKLRLHSQLQTASAETADCELCVEQYRRGLAGKLTELPTLPS